MSSNITTRELGLDTLDGSLFKLYDQTALNGKFYEYSLNGVVGGNSKLIWLDFQTLNLMSSLQRAKRIEEQVPPQANVISERNKFLETLGEALAQCSKLEAMFKSDDGPEKEVDADPDTTLFDVMKKYFGKTSWIHNDNWRLSDLKECSQLLKSKIDALNADAQQDMTRLQGLMDKRDQGFTLASDLMSTDSDTIGSIIRNITP